MSTAPIHSPRPLCQAAEAAGRLCAGRHEAGARLVRQQEEGGRQDDVITGTGDGGTDRLGAWAVGPWA